MRIDFSSDVRPVRISKSIKKRLDEEGRGFPYSQVREAAAVMFGYHGWNDLLAQVGVSKPSPYDDELDEAERFERAQLFAKRLARALDLPSEQASKVVRAVGPMSRSPHGAADTASPHVRSVAYHVSQRYPRISPAFRGRFSGFRIEGLIVRGRMMTVDLLTAADGDVIYGTPEDSRFSEKTPQDELGLFLHDNGLGRPPVLGDLAISPLVLETLSRLDCDVLDLLRGAPAFSCDAYRLARSIPQSSAFLAECVEYPLLAAEIERAAEAGRKNRGVPDRTVIDSEDPLDALARLALTSCKQRWPIIEPPTASRVRDVSETVLRMHLSGGPGVSPCHLAFLGLAPDEGIPRTSEQLRAAIGFIDNNPHVFAEDGLCVAPSAFFAELGQRFDNNWLRLSAYASRSGLPSVDVPGEVGTILVMAAAAEIDALDRMPDPVGRPATLVVGRHFARKAIGNLGFAGAIEKLAGLREAVPLLSRVSPRWADLGMAALRRAGFVPDDGRSAMQIVRSFGMGAAALAPAGRQDDRSPELGPS